MAKGTRNIQGEMDIQTEKGTATLRVVPEGEGQSKTEPKKDPDPDKPVTAPVAAVGIAPPVAPKPIRIKIDTETGAVWETVATLDEAEKRCELVTHYGLREFRQNRIIYHAPHCVHRAIIDL